MLKKSQLIETQRAAGAEFAENLGWEVPLRFSSVNDEYEILHKDAGILDLSACGVFELKGEDRTRFLHGMVTNDIKALQPGNGCYAALLTPQGKMIADLRVFCLEDSYVLTVEPSLRDSLAPSLRKYIIGDRPQLLDRSEELAILSFQGSKALEILSHLISGPLPLPPFGHLTCEIGGLRAQICRVDRIVHIGYDIILERSNLVDFWQLLMEKGKLMGAKPVGLEAYNIHRIEAGIPWYGLDMDESTLPHEAGLEKNAISLTKGCYIGQESVARITYRGQVNRRLTGLLLASNQPASKGDKIFKGEQEVGWITSSAYSPGLQKAIALGYVRRDSLETSTSLRVRHDDGSLECEITTLPFTTTLKPLPST